MEKISPNALSQLIDIVYLTNETVESKINSTKESTIAATDEGNSLSTVKESQKEIRADITEQKEEILLQYVGGNAKGVVILTNNNLEKAPADKQFLLKVMGAVNLKLEDIAIIHSTPETNNWQNNLKCSHVIDFGSKSDIVPKNYEITKIEGVKWVKADSLIEIQNNIQLKKNLWGNLKSLFS